MRPRDRELYERIRQGLAASARPLPGIGDAANRNCLIEQILESVHRVKFVSVILDRPIDDRRADPSSNLFDPLKGAIVHLRQGNIDEAYWLIFFFVHFGKNGRGKWRYAREVYGRLNQGGLWNWTSTSQNPTGFRLWLDQNQAQLGRAGGGFGNHRKYQSLSAVSPTGTGEAVATYVRWIGPARSHHAFFQDAIARCGNDPRRSFSYLYDSMDAVASFGRTARFDYLTMVGKLGLANIEPGSAYMGAATGPVTGARLLFSGNRNAGTSAATLDGYIIQLDTHLQVGMQVLEDALCNWQKSPNRFTAFRG